MESKEDKFLLSEIESEVSKQHISFFEAVSVVRDLYKLPDGTDELDKSDEPVYMHSVRIALLIPEPVQTSKMSDGYYKKIYDKFLINRMAALIHDVVEDEKTTFDGLLKRGFHPEAVEKAKILTNLEEPEYIKILTEEINSFKNTIYSNYIINAPYFIPEDTISISYNKANRWIEKYYSALDEKKTVTKALKTGSNIELNDRLLQLKEEKKDIYKRFNKRIRLHEDILVDKFMDMADNLSDIRFSKLSEKAQFDKVHKYYDELTEYAKKVSDIQNNLLWENEHKIVVGQVIKNIEKFGYDVDILKSLRFMNGNEKNLKSSGYSRF